MKHIVRHQPNARLWPNPWRMALIALCALILCSCRSPSKLGATAGLSSSAGSTVGQASRGTRAAPPDGRGDTLPREAYTGVPAGAGVPMAQPDMEQGVPLPYQPQGPWAPSGLSRPWPADEYIRDGGDVGVPADVSGRGELGGLEMEDTVAHYDTLDGRTLVEPSNKVYLYAPRFGAVRQVVGLVAHEERQHIGGVYLPEHLNSPTTLQLVADAEQNVQAAGEAAARPAVALRTRAGDGVMSSVIHPRAFQDAFKPYENLSVVRMGVFEGAEMSFLARASEAAIAWSHIQAVQVILDHTGAMAEVKYDKALSLYTVSSPPGDPKLRLVKVASTPFAQPGDEVFFTLRFDNIGNQPLGNVTIIDSLNTRLEYVADSAQCSVEAKFSTQPNEGDSMAVRCELARPLEPGQGGILRFRCRVR
ncbi:MAG: DUF11 domain-containing protein [Planctomycetes bacterium]|nr:DUF11 domain-containing protein [Planctomycetota bacterium]MBU4400038.1 DUF11 domain-containing protein [Planctomycetota bacterium]MCG2683513.1 DUF11 domain-containing protein [Planctomycetales bacterium]